jgi:predicted acetyltransferase
MGTEVRTITTDEMPAWTEAMRNGFHGHAAEGEVERRARWIDLSRTWAAFDGSRVVGTTRSFATELTVPGGATVPAGALTNVTVLGTHRRQGLARRMVEADLALCRERGEAASVLIAAEWPIYGRYGYGPAIDACDWTLDASATFAVAGEGEVEAVTPEELLTIAPEVYERARRANHGHIARVPVWWSQLTGVETFPGEDPWRGFQVVVRNGGGTVTGYASYKVDGKWDQRRPRSTVEVEDWVTVSPEASCRLWRHLAQLDWVTTVKSEVHGVDEPLRWWLADARHAVQSDRGDYVWLRPLDVVALLGARRSTVEGALVLEVVDPDGPAAGTYQWDTGPDGASCQRTTRTAEVSLTATALGAAVLGSRALAAMATTHHVAGTPATVAKADALLGWPVAPWCNTHF